ncbi:MAG: NEW3 domain-containing protein [Desulfobacteraceae bacterium]
MNFLRRGVVSACFVTLILAAFALPSEARTGGDESDDNRPERAIDVSPEYPGVVVPQGEEVRLDLVVTNRGKRPETVLVTLSEVPEGWNARLKSYKFDVTGAHVPEDDTKRLTFVAEPDEDLEQGEYTFLISAKTPDGRLRSSTSLQVRVSAEEEVTKTKDVTITTSYPVLRGPTDATFEFSLDVENKLDKDMIYNVSARGPKDWDVNLKPAYEDKYISSLRIKAGASKSMAVEVKPHAKAEPGEYPINVKVSAEGSEAEAELTVDLTGTHKLDMGTADGRLSLNAYQGEEAKLSFYLKNSGSATQQDIKFLSFQPEGWDVKFSPERIDTLAPGDIEQVDATITPRADALVGDYSVNLSARGQRVDKSLELRVAVKASTAWSWVGIGIILLVIAGLVVLFIRMGRR